MNNIIKQLAKSVLIPWGLIAAKSVADTEIHKKIIGLGTTTFQNFKQRNVRYYEKR